MSLFRAGLRFHTKPLDPQVYQGDDFLPNILRHLKIDPRLLSNPTAYKEIAQKYAMFESFEPIQKARTKYEKDPSSENLKDYVDIIEQTKVLTQEELHALYGIESKGVQESLTYQNMSVDKKSRSITFQTISEKNQAPSQCVLTTYAVDKKGNIVEDITTTLTNKGNMKDTTERTISTFNSDGINISKQIRKNAEEISVGHQEFEREYFIERDEKNPFILKIVEKTGRTLFMVVRDDFNNLLQKFNVGENAFFAYEDALKFYEQIKGKIAFNIKLQMVRKYQQGSFESQETEHTLDGICKLAKNAGLSGFEFPTEPRI